MANLSALRNALAIALRDGAHGALRGVQRTASSALDHAEGALMHGGFWTGLGAGPVAGAAALGGGFDSEDGRALATGVAIPFGVMGTVGMLGGGMMGRRQLIRTGLEHSLASMRHYVRNLRRLGFHEEAAQAETALSIAKRTGESPKRVLERMEEAASDGRARHEASKSDEALMRYVAERIRRAQRRGDL